jgi:hypothetical protein
VFHKYFGYKVFLFISVSFFCRNFPFPIVNEIKEEVEEVEEEEENRKQIKNYFRKKY